jgi:hypothetical protein
METETSVPSEAPVKLTKSRKPRKPFVMTPARQAAFEKWPVWQNALREHPPFQILRMFNAPKSKHSGLMMQ